MTLEFVSSLTLCKRKINIPISGLGRDETPMNLSRNVITHSLFSCICHSIMAELISQMNYGASIIHNRTQFMLPYVTMC